jgi:hypothetical protein
MRPLISVLSAIGRFCAVITPTAGGGAPGPACPIAGEASKSNFPKKISPLQKETFIVSLSRSAPAELNRRDIDPSLGVVASFR